MNDERHVSPKPRRTRAKAAPKRQFDPEQRTAAAVRRAERETRRYQEELARDIEAFRQEFPPAVDRELIEALAALRSERERQGLSLTDMAERTGIDRATISKLETGKIPNPTISTLRTYAKALGRKLAWTLQEVGDL